MNNEYSATELGALQCSGCGKLYLPPKYHCSRCGGSNFYTVNLKGDGEIYSSTVIRVPFEKFMKEAPYLFAEVKLDEGLVVPGRLGNEKGKEVKIGSRVSFLKYEQGVNWFRLI